MLSKDVWCLVLRYLCRDSLFALRLVNHDLNTAVFWPHLWRTHIQLSNASMRKWKIIFSHLPAQHKFEHVTVLPFLQTPLFTNWMPAKKFAVTLLDCTQTQDAAVWMLFAKIERIDAKTSWDNDALKVLLASKAQIVLTTEYGVPTNLSAVEQNQVVGLVNYDQNYVSIKDVMLYDNLKYLVLSVKLSELITSCYKILGQLQVLGCKLDLPFEEHATLFPNLKELIPMVESVKFEGYIENLESLSLANYKASTIDLSKMKKLKSLKIYGTLSSYNSMIRINNMAPITHFSCSTSIMFHDAQQLLQDLKHIKEVSICVQIPNNASLSQLLSKSTVKHMNKFCIELYAATSYFYGDSNFTMPEMHITSLYIKGSCKNLFNGCESSLLPFVEDFMFNSSDSNAITHAEPYIATSIKKFSCHDHALRAISLSVFPYVTELHVEQFSNKFDHPLWQMFPNLRKLTIINTGRCEQDFVDCISNMKHLVSLQYECSSCVLRPDVPLVIGILRANPNLKYVDASLNMYEDLYMDEIANSSCHYVRVGQSAFSFGSVTTVFAKFNDFSVRKHGPIIDVHSKNTMEEID